MPQLHHDLCATVPGKQQHGCRFCYAAGRTATHRSTAQRCVAPAAPLLRQVRRFGSREECAAGSSSYRSGRERLACKRKTARGGGHCTAAAEQQCSGAENLSAVQLSIQPRGEELCIFVCLVQWFEIEMVLDYIYIYIISRQACMYQSSTTWSCCIMSLALHECLCSQLAVIYSTLFHHAYD